MQPTDWTDDPAHVAHVDSRFTKDEAKEAKRGAFLDVAVSTSPGGHIKDRSHAFHVTLLHARQEGRMLAEARAGWCPHTENT